MPAPGKDLLPSLAAIVKSISGADTSSIKVHYNSSDQAAVDAHAYAQGTDIHLGPGQQHTLAHEAWHAVQQRGGRVGDNVRSHIGLSKDERALAVESDLLSKRTPVPLK